ncbi:hypothetical protein AgCh_025612 [Apium graveolens]
MTVSVGDLTLEHVMWHEDSGRKPWENRRCQVNLLQQLQHLVQNFVERIQSEIATSLTTAAAAELPCTVKFIIWPHNAKEPG